VTFARRKESPKMFHQMALHLAMWLAATLAEFLVRRWMGN
jgi:hypothetical protein